MTNKQIILVARPKGLPTLENFKIEEVVLPDIQDGELLLEGMYYQLIPICEAG